MAGICVMYKSAGKNNWLNIDSFAYDSPVTIDMTNFVEKDETYEIIIYPPILSSIKKLQIKLPEGFTASKTSWNINRNIVVAGGSISFGLGCNNVNNMLSNILERNFNAEVNHIAFNTNNYLELIEDYYNTVNPNIADVIVLELDDYSQKESMIEEELPKLISLLKNKCKLLIGWYCIPNNKSFKKIIANNVIKSFINDKELEVIDMSFLYDDDYKDMCVYSNWFINDSGNIMIYKKLEENIRRFTKWNI